MPYIAKFANFVVYSYSTDAQSLVTLRLYRLRRGAFNLIAVVRRALGCDPRYCVVNRIWCVEIIPKARLFRGEEIHWILKRLGVHQYIDMYTFAERLTHDGFWQLCLRVEGQTYLWSLVCNGVPFLNAEARQSAEALKKLISVVVECENDFVKYFRFKDRYQDILKALNRRLGEEEFWR